MKKVKENIDTVNDSLYFLFRVSSPQLTFTNHDLHRDLLELFMILRNSVWVNDLRHRMNAEPFQWRHRFFSSRRGNYVDRNESELFVFHPNSWLSVLVRTIAKKYLLCVYVTRILRKLDQLALYDL